MLKRHRHNSLSSENIHDTNEMIKLKQVLQGGPGKLNLQVTQTPTAQSSTALPSLPPDTFIISWEIPYEQLTPSLHQK